MRKRGSSNYFDLGPHRFLCKVKMPKDTDERLLPPTGCEIDPRPNHLFKYTYATKLSALDQGLVV